MRGCFSVLVALVVLLSGILPAGWTLRCQVTGERHAVCCCTGQTVDAWLVAAESSGGCGCCDPVSDDEEQRSGDLAIPTGSDQRTWDLEPMLAGVLPTTMPSFRGLDERDRLRQAHPPMHDPPRRRPLYLVHAALLI